MLWLDDYYIYINICAHWTLADGNPKAFKWHCQACLLRNSKILHALYLTVLVVGFWIKALHRQATASEPDSVWKILEVLI